MHCDALFSMVKEKLELCVWRCFLEQFMVRLCAHPEGVGACMCALVLNLSIHSYTYLGWVADPDWWILVFSGQQRVIISLVCLSVSALGTFEKPLQLAPLNVPPDRPNISIYLGGRIQSPLFQLLYLKSSTSQPEKLFWSFFFWQTTTI